MHLIPISRTVLEIEIMEDVRWRHFSAKRKAGFGQRPTSELSQFVQNLKAEFSVGVISRQFFPLGS